MALLRRIRSVPAHQAHQGRRTSSMPPGTARTGRRSIARICGTARQAAPRLLHDDRQRFVRAALQRLREQRAPDRSQRPAESGEGSELARRTLVHERVQLRRPAHQGVPRRRDHATPVSLATVDIMHETSTALPGSWASTGTYSFDMTGGSGAFRNVAADGSGGVD